MNQNKFIVIEGPDGSGKKTQFLRLVEKLKNAGYEISAFDFPQYSDASSHFVREYLAGKYGGLDDVGPHKASIFFALDRFGATGAIKNALASQKIVVSNRYVASNMAHQGAKIKKLNDRLEYFKWLHDFEFNVLGIAKPGLNIILSVSQETSQKLLDKTGKVKDIYETDIDYQKAVGNIYAEIAELFPDDFKIINCMADNQLLSPEVIEQKVWEVVKEYLKI